MAEGGGGGGGSAASAALKDQGNEQFKAGNYLKAAALYTQAIKLDPDNPTLYSNRAAAFLHLVKLNKALADADTTIKLKPQWEKGHFRKGCVLESMEHYEEVRVKDNSLLFLNREKDNYLFFIFCYVSFSQAFRIWQAEKIVVRNTLVWKCTYHLQLSKVKF
jgi:tetratricopeptide (TPR) repeat protein